jgi:hypothetical protein
MRKSLPFITGKAVEGGRRSDRMKALLPQTFCLQEKEVANQSGRLI